MAGPGRFQGYTLPAPTKGFNPVDPIDQMDPAFALEISNLYPNGTTTVLRGGYAYWNTATSGFNAFKFFGALPKLDGDTWLIGANGDRIDSFDGYNSNDNITGTTTPTSSAFNGFLYSTETNGNVMFLPNGADTPQLYDGVAPDCVDITFTGPSDLTKLITGMGYKERVYFLERNTFNWWYGGLNAIGSSALTKLPLASFFQYGGFGLFCGSFTNQTFSGSVELAFFVSSEGEILLYQGLYPGDVSTPWQLVARFKTAKPLSYRAWFRVDNDVWLITESGIVSLAQLFSGDANSTATGPGRYINPVIAQYAKTVGFNYLWHGVHWPQGRRVYLVIPTSETTTRIAVYSIDAQAWTFYDLADPGDCVGVAIADETPYFAAGDGYVWQAEYGYVDRAGAGVASHEPTPISYSYRGAFSFFGDRSTFKKFIDIRPLLKSSNGLSLSLGMDTNFQKTGDLSTISTTSGTFTPWGSPWGSPWSTGLSYIYERFATKGQGHSGAIRFAGNLSGAPLEIYGIEIRFEPGGQV